RLLSTPEMRASYPMPFFRLLIDVVLIAALVLGLLSVAIARLKTRGLLGASLAVLALVLGGSRVAVAPSIPKTPSVGLDWFLLSLFFTALVFVPLERIFARVRQRV